MFQLAAIRAVNFTAEKSRVFGSRKVCRALKMFLRLETTAMSELATATRVSPTVFCFSLQINRAKQ